MQMPNSLSSKTMAVIDDIQWAISFVIWHTKSHTDIQFDEKSSI